VTARGSLPGGDGHGQGGGGPSVGDEVRRALLARRVVLLHGTLDDAAVAEAAATLMMLDASGDERIVLRITGATATIDQALVLMDVMGVLGVPVDTAAAGTVAGGAVGVFSSGRSRLLAPHARLHLQEPDGSVAGRAVEIERALAAQTSQRDRYLERLAACTGRPRADVALEWGTGRFLEPADAVTLGYADGVEIAGRAGPLRGA
jgi:ATP-dependent Clp protease, protease subunit